MNSGEGLGARGGLRNSLDCADSRRAAGADFWARAGLSNPIREAVSVRGLWRRSGRIMSGMTTTPRRASAPKPKPAPRRSAPSAPADALPFLRFHHSAALRKKTLALLDAIEQADDATVRRDELAELVVELTGSGLDAFFLKPLKAARAGFIVEQSAALGMKGVQQVMASVIRQIIGRMGSPQLLSVSASIRQFMV